LVETRHAGQEDRDEVVAVAVRHVDLVDRLQQTRQFRGDDGRQELGVVFRLRVVEQVLLADRHHDLVD